MKTETFSFDWKDAENWQENQNERRNDDIQWRWDCNFKLDFDGGLVTVSSRFYPPHKNISGKWEGDMDFNVCGNKWVSFSLKKDTLEEIRQEAERIVKRQSEIVYSRIVNI